MIWREGASSLDITEIELICEFLTLRSPQYAEKWTCIPLNNQHFKLFEDKVVAGLQCWFHSEVKGNTKAVINDSLHKE